MKIGGASLGELLRHGSQFGLGVQDAGRQNAREQYDVNRQNRDDEQKALLQQALLDQYHASAERDRAYSKNLAIPDPPKQFNPQQTAGRIRKWMSENPGASYQDAIASITAESPGQVDSGVAYDSWADIDRQNKSDARSAASAARAGVDEPTRGEEVADATGYAELWAAQMEDAAKLPDFDRRAIEDAATKNLLAQFPGIGTYEASRLVRRAFRSVLDAKTPIIIDDDYASRIRAAATDTIR